MNNMNTWMNRLAIFAVVGAILSSAVLVGCGSPAEDTNAVTTNTAVAPADEQ